MKIVYGINTGTGSSVSGHFINDTGATIEAAAEWIVRRTLNQLPEDYTSKGWNVCLWIDGKVAFERTY